MIASYLTIPILIHAQCTRCMLDKQVEQPNFVLLQLWEFLHDVVRYKVGAPGAGREVDCALEPGHCYRLSVSEGQV
jgi:hypothetical protein